MEREDKLKYIMERKVMIDATVNLRKPEGQNVSKFENESEILKEIFEDLEFAYAIMDMKPRFVKLESDEKKPIYELNCYCFPNGKQSRIITRKLKGKYKG